MGGQGLIPVTVTSWAIGKDTLGSQIAYMGTMSVFRIGAGSVELWLGALFENQDHIFIDYERQQQYRCSNHH